MKNPQVGEQLARVGWLIDGRGGAAKRDVVISIADGRITRIEPFQPTHGEHHNFLDFFRYTLMPVLIDAHVHLALSGTRNPEKRQRQLSPEPDEAMNTIESHLACYACGGIMAVRDGGDRYGHVLAYQNLLSTEKQPQVNISATCWAWHARGRYGRMIGRSPQEGVGQAKALDFLAEGMRHIKLIHSGLNSLDRFGHSGPPQFSCEELYAAVASAHNAGLPVMVHANGATAVAQAIQAGCDSIEHGYFMGEDNLARLADAGIAWVPTVIPMAALADDPSLTDRRRDTALRTREHQLDQVRRGHRLGVPIVLGTDAGSAGVDHALAVPLEMELLKQAGLSEEEIVCCATGRAARLLGLSGCNVIMPGEHANFVMVRRAPTEIIAGLQEIDSICVEGCFHQQGFKP